MIFNRKTISEQMAEIESNLKAEKLKKEMNMFQKQRIMDLKQKKMEYKKLKYENSPYKSILAGAKKLGNSFIYGIQKIQDYNAKQEKIAKEQRKKKKKVVQNNWNW
jgi:hypothetical protein